MELLIIGPAKALDELQPLEKGEESGFGVPLAGFPEFVR